ncbi:MAG: Fe-S cluster assembly protein SufD [Pseudomonadota bacterium]
MPSTAALNGGALHSAVTRLASGPGDAERRRQALDAFLGSGFPTRASEAWRYTSTAPLAALTGRWLEAAPERAAATGATDLPSGQLRFVDGRLVGRPEALSLPAGVTLRRAERQADTPGEPLRALNAALGDAPLELAIDAGTIVEHPIVVTHEFTNDATPLFAGPGIHVRAGAACQATLVERFDAARGGELFCNVRVTADLDESARLRHFRLQTLPAEALVVAATDATLGRSARYRYFTLDAGAAVARVDLDVRLDGAGAHADLGGVALAGAAQTIDHHLLTRHRCIDASSTQDVACIAADDGTVTFRGKVIVDSGADGTDSKQSSRNLLLSDKATVNTRPELEIYADDVKCAHGATTGQLDADALFYLAARGLEPAAAREVLIRAFVLGTLSAVADEALRQDYDRAMNERLQQMLVETAL